MKDYKNLNDYEIIYMINENNEEAMNLLLKKYKPVIIKLAMYYYGRCKNCGLEFEDFVQEGNYALFYATKKYKDNKDSVFYTYAILCIRGKMQNLIIRNTTNKNSVLNNSISLFEEMNENSELIDYLEDKSTLLPDEMLIKSEKYNYLKSFLYELPFDHSIVFELKMNGFSNCDISTLLEKDNEDIRRLVSAINKNLRNYIEKINI